MTKHIVDTQTFQEERNSWELFLMNLRYKQAEQIEVGGRKTILLNEPNTLWMVYTGEADIFSVRVENGEAVGTRQYLFTQKAGHIMLGNAYEDSANALLVSGNPGTKLIRLHPEAFEQVIDSNPEYQPIIIYLIEKWIQQLTQVLSNQLLPRDYETLRARIELALPDKAIAKPFKQTLWIQLQSGQVNVTGLKELTVNPGEDWLPISHHSWLVAQGDSSLTTQSTKALFHSEKLWANLAGYQSRLMFYLGEHQHQAIEEDEARLRDKQIAINQQVGEAIEFLAAPLQGGQPAPVWEYSPEPLLAACELVAEQLDIHISPPKNMENLATLSPTDAVQFIARSSRFRTRKVALRDKWWQEDNGTLLGFLQDTMQPVALIQTRPGNYEMVNPQNQTRVPVNATTAGQLHQFGDVFYRPFPYKALTLRDLMFFGMRGLRRDLITVFVAGGMVAILQILTPLLSQVVFDRIIPAGNQNTLLYVAAALLGAALGTLLVNLSYSLSILRIENRFEANLQTALWDRLLELPIDFFQQYTSGDLANRASGISMIKTVLTTVFVSSVLPAIYGFANLIMLFYFSPLLAMVALALGAIALGFMLWVGKRTLALQRAVADIQGETYGHVLQLITGIAKFRVAFAESHAFLSWAQRFGQQRDISFQSRSLQNSLVVFNTFYPLFTQAIIFSLLVTTQQDLSTGTFMAFVIAYTMFLNAIFALGGGIVSVFAVAPIYERAQPILETLPEVDNIKSDPGALSGAIELNHITFRYSDSTPLVLDDVSFKVEPGQFLAIVGESGSGKSTLMRLLLGFHQPESGVIYYDGLDLSQLDIKAVRRQMGVVLQNSELTTGQDIFRNIVGSSGLTMDDAWQAADNAGLAEDIRQMPMGMATLISTGGGTLSGGQKQRVLIARALVRKPHIIFFDEATSALDNRTQAIVSESLEQMEATRIVIAHRLSTIIHADYILVMDNGRIIEQGNYQELMALDGHFAHLAKRQLV